MEDYQIIQIQKRSQVDTYFVANVHTSHISPSYTDITLEIANNSAGQ